MPLDLVDAGSVEALERHVEALTVRVRELRAMSVAGGTPLDALRDQASAALRIAVPPREQDVPIYAAWGCPTCGRIDAPQPCLGVCIRRPVLMADASEYLRVAVAADHLAAREAELARVARMAANVRPRPGHEEATAEALRAAGEAALKLSRSPEA